eukprot:4780129-Prymnesium_polylepis.1
MTPRAPMRSNRQRKGQGQAPKAQRTKLKGTSKQDRNTRELRHAQCRHQSLECGFWSNSGLG